MVKKSHFIIVTGQLSLNNTAEVTVSLSYNNSIEVAISLSFSKAT